MSTTVSWVGLAISLLLVVVTAGISRWQGLRPERQILLAAARALVLRFIDEHIGPEVALTTEDKAFVEEALPKLRAEQGKIRALVERRMRNLRPALAEVPTTWCPDCGQPAVLLEHTPAGEPECLNTFSRDAHSGGVLPGTMLMTSPSRHSDSTGIGPLRMVAILPASTVQNAARKRSSGSTQPPASRARHERAVFLMPRRVG
jgi:hypothetical protein